MCVWACMCPQLGCMRLETMDVLFSALRPKPSLTSSSSLLLRKQLNSLFLLHPDKGLSSFCYVQTVLWSCTWLSMSPRLTLVLYSTVWRCSLMGLNSSGKEKCPNPRGPWGRQLKLPCCFVTLNTGTVPPPKSLGLQTYCHSGHWQLPSADAHLKDAHKPFSCFEICGAAGTSVAINTNC